MVDTLDDESYVKNYPALVFKKSLLLTAELLETMPLKHLKKTSITLTIILCVFLIYKLFIAAPKNFPKPDIKTVEVEQVQLKDIQQTAQFIGTIKSQKATVLVAKHKGILDRMVESGQKVRKGDLIAKIVNEDIENNHLLSQKAEKIAKLQYERSGQIFQSGGTSKNTVEEKESAWIESQKKLSDARIALNDINLYAPFEGITGIFKIREGSQVQEGDAIVTLYDPSIIIVEFDVPLSVANVIHDGSSIFINQHQYALTHIQKMLDEQLHMCPAYVNIDCDNCIIGTTVDVNVVIQEKKSVIVIPYEAIVLRTGKPFAYVVKNNKAVLIAITLGMREKDQIEITSGLKIGDAVIVHGQTRLYPDVAVKIAREKITKTQ